MLYDLDKPSKFVSDIYHCLDDRGIWILQVSYAPLMINLNALLANKKALSLYNGKKE